MKNAPPLADNRQLAVVMFLDMVSYSARMAAEEVNAMACVADLETILEEKVPAFDGRLVKFMGDGSMSCFPTAGAAVSCALQILEAIRERNKRFPLRQQFRVRIGLHLGDVVFEKGDLFGDAVNIAARVQPWADPGGIAMTGIVHSQVRNKILLPGIFLPPVKLKNITEEIPIYSVAPREKNLFLWKFRKRREWAWTLLILVMCLTVSTMGYFQSQIGPRNWALMGILAPTDENSKRAAEAVRLLVEMDFATIHGVQWVKPKTAFAVLQQMGVGDPVQAVEKLDLAAFHAAWQGGVKDLVLFRLEPLGTDHWRLHCRIFSTQGRVLAASFSAEGEELPDLVAKLRRQAQEWVERNN